MPRAATNSATGLSAKMEEFCFQTVRLGDHNKAYRLAYDASGMAQVSVRKEASRLLHDQRVVDRITQLQAVADSKLEVSIERIAKETARIAFLDCGELFDEDGRPIPIHMLPKDIRHAVESVTIVERKAVQPVMVKMDKAGNVIGEVKPGEKPTKDQKRAAKAAAKQGVKADMETSTGLDFMPIRERKITLHGKLKALELLARWKKMIHERGEEGEDLGDLRNMTDDALEAELRANTAALEMIDRARKRQGKPKQQKV